MQTPANENIDNAVSLFDVVISMPPGAELEAIQKLAETEAGLTPERVERLIHVLRSTPNAKVGAGLTLERAEQEKARFVKAGLHVQLTPLVQAQSPAASVNQKIDQEVVEASPDVQIDAALDTKAQVTKRRSLTKTAGLLVAAALLIYLGILSAGKKNVTIGGFSLPWGNKNAQPVLVSAPASQQVTTGPSSEVEADDPILRAVQASITLASGPASTTETVPKPLKQQLTAEFGVMLAEIGHVARAREVLKALATTITPAADTQANSALQAAQVKLQAWSVQGMDASQASRVAEDLKSKTQVMTTAQERAQLQGQVAVILSRGTQLPLDVPRMFLAMASESSKGATGGQTSASLGDLAVWSAEVSLNETTARAKAGAWSKAKASASQIEDLLKQAPDAWAQSRLYAISYQAKAQTGQSELAAKSLESALALATKNSNLPERAMWLRSIARLSDASTQEQFELAATSLQAQLAAKSGAEKARGLTELSLLYTAAGLPGKAGQLRSQAQATTGLGAAESTAINTDLLVRGDMALAKLLHGLGRYSEAEAVLQRVVGYLF